MSYSIVLFSNWFFNFSGIIWTLKIFNNFLNSKTLFFEMVKLIFFLIFEIVKFNVIKNSKMLNFDYSLIFIIQQF